MAASDIWRIYEARLRRVSDHIHAHLDDELDTARLAEIACLSEHHWHRVYRAVHGETLAETVRRLRLHRAAGDLVTTDRPVREIAARWGYADLSSFTRAFKAGFGLPPARYRREGSHALFQSAITGETKDMYDLSIRSIPETPLVGIPHAGSYMAIGRAFEALYGMLFSRTLFDPAMRMIGVYLDDPDLVPEERLRSFACVTAAGGTVAEPPLESRRIEGGDYAVLRHRGPYADMSEAYRWLYGRWLPQSGRALRDAPVFEAYLNNPREVAPTDLLTEIHLPLKPAG
ncbi:AraC family transcriptional regulator [Rhizobium sp. TRM95111]|uniref:AraC family transcriptional regulator n=1 Tax=Rhizobium alarense TaxID=2846851 RepID=UPI001F430C0B|nr:AraC family transcriptional regulator [Rhizobium alarense]MCF3643297.1 AraC family transcriptional regulator [Rhizobium alarense]